MRRTHPADVTPKHCRFITIYLARGPFVCQLSGSSETPTRTLTNIVVQNIDGVLREKRK